jgi:hypothetical protein
MESTFVLHDTKSTQFLSFPNFLSTPLLEVGLTKNLGTLRPKFLEPINFIYELFYFKKYIKKLKQSNLWPLLTSHYIQRLSS